MARLVAGGNARVKTPSIGRLIWIHYSVAAADTEQYDWPMKRSGIVLLILLAVFLTTVASVWGYAIIVSGHKISEMDWDSDGNVELSEILFASEVGKRTIRIDGQECTEFFLWKDATPVKTICDSDG